MHYPTDVLGGALTGIMSGYLGYGFMKIAGRKLLGIKNGGETDEHRKYKILDWYKIRITAYLSYRRIRRYSV